MVLSNSFSNEGEKECYKLGSHFVSMFAPTPAKVDCGFVFGDYVVEITENGRLVNKFIASADNTGQIGTIRIIGINLSLYYNRYVSERKVLWFNANDCERDGWDEYIEFSIVH